MTPAQVPQWRQRTSRLQLSANTSCPLRGRTDMSATDLPGLLRLLRWGPLYHALPLGVPGTASMARKHALLVRSAWSDMMMELSAPGSSILSPSRYRSFIQQLPYLSLASLSASAFNTSAGSTRADLSRSSTEAIDFSYSYAKRSPPPPQHGSPVNHCDFSRPGSVSSI